MAHDRRVSFGTQQPARWTEGGDGHGLIVVRPQSVFNRLGPKAGMGDPPYVPESVGEAPLPGMIFGCTNETYTECINWELFGLPIANKPQVMRISPGASLFLFNFRTKHLHGIFEATSHGGLHIVRHAFGGKFGAQVKVRLAEECPSLSEREFKEAIMTNYVDARKFKFPLNEAQVCRLKTLFRTKAVDAWAVSEGIIDHGFPQFHPSERQHARNSIQVQRRVNNSAYNNEVEGSRTLRISVPPVVSRVHASPSLIQSRPSMGLEVSIFSKDNNRNGAPNSPRRQVVMYDARKEQSTTPVLRSKITRPVKEVVQPRSGHGISQDRKRCADRSPHRRLLLQEQGQETSEDRSGKHCADLRELLTRPNLKRLKPSTKESAKRLLSKPTGPVDFRGRPTKSDVLSKGNLEKDLEQGLPLPSKIHSTISLVPQKALSSKDLVVPKLEGSVKESGKNAETIGPVKGVQGNPKSASSCADSRIQSLKASGSGHVNPTPIAVGAEGRAVLQACTSKNAYNNVDLKPADGDGVSSCVQLSTSLPVKSGVPHKLDGVVTKSDLGDQSKDEGLDIYVSLTVGDAEIARQTDSRIESESQHGMEGVIRCIPGKGSGESKQLEPALGSPMATQAPQTERFVQQQKEGPKESNPEKSLRKVSSPATNVSETVQKMEIGICVPSAEEYYLTFQTHSRNASLDMENLSEEEKRLGHLHVAPSNDTVPVVSTVIMGNTGDMEPRDCKRHRAEEESGPSGPAYKLNKTGQDDAGCSYVTAGVSIPTEGGDMREKDPQKYGLDYKMPLQTPPNSLFSGKSENLWNSRTLRYGRPRSSDALTNHGSRFSKSGSEPMSTAGKLEPNVEGMKIGEESVYSGGENFERQPESPNATETSITSGILGTQHPLLVCELGNPGGLPLDGKTIKVDSMDDSPQKGQAIRVAVDTQQSVLPSEIDSFSRPDRLQSVNTALDPRSDELQKIELRKKTATMKDLTEEESQVAHKLCHPDDFSSHPATIASSRGRAHLSLLSGLPHGANAPRDARALVEGGDQHCLDATSRDIPSACTSTASLSGCLGFSGEAELEVSIPIEEEELEICLPIEEDEDVDAVPENQTRRVWEISNRDITPWKLLQRNPLQDT